MPLFKFLIIQRRQYFFLRVYSLLIQYFFISPIKLSHCALWLYNLCHCRENIVASHPCNNTNWERTKLEKNKKKYILLRVMWLRMWQTENMWYDCTVHCLPLDGVIVVCRCRRYDHMFHCSAR